MQKINLNWAVIWALTLAGGCAAPTLSHADMRQQILDMEARDQAVRQEWIDVGVENADQDLMMRLLMTDLENTTALKALIEEHGWPTAEMIGTDGVEAAFLLVQHADKDPKFQRKMMPHIQEAHRQGHVSGHELALLTDRVLIGMGRPQRFGTQAEIVDGKIVMKPVKDHAELDQRRAEQLL